MTDLSIELAAPADLPSVLRVLAAAGLPNAGVAAVFPTGYAVARDAADVVGVAGLERYGASALLRSVAVVEAARGQGLAQKLVADRLAAAKAMGTHAVYLLTTTAGAYFPRLGFERTSRQDVPEELKQSAEFASICPASAVCLVKLVT